MALRKINRDLISLIEKTIIECRVKSEISCSFENISKEDYLSISEYLFKTYSSVSVVYNCSTGCCLTIGI